MLLVGCISTVSLGPYTASSITLWSEKMVGVTFTLWMSSALFVKQRSRTFLRLVGCNTTCSMNSLFVRSSRDSACLCSCAVIPERKWPSGHLTLGRLKSPRRSMFRLWSSLVSTSSIFEDYLQICPHDMGHLVADMWYILPF